MTAKRLLMGAVTGLVLGAVLLGAGGRLVMRGLALLDGRAVAFSMGGSAEVLLYGAIVGAITGAAYSLVPGPFRRRWIAAGMLLGAASYSGTLLTLPPHIALTAAPFAEHMVAVHAGFGGCFLVFGLALARTARRD